jgi:hypothetical protein
LPRCIRHLATRWRLACDCLFLERDTYISALTTYFLRRINNFIADKGISVERQWRKATGPRFLRDANSDATKDPKIAGLPKELEGKAMRSNKQTTIFERLEVSRKGISQVLSLMVQLRKSLVLAAIPLMLAGVPAPAQLTGSMSIAENACVLPIATFVFRNCGYSGGANISADLGANVWIGPVTGGGFYSSIAAAPGFVFSTKTGVDDNGVPLTSFLIGLPDTPGDGKVAPTVTGDISVDTATNIISGSFTLGPGARLTGTAGSLAGDKTAVESWASITHVLTPKLPDSIVVGNAYGGSDYIIGSVGFPPLLCSGFGAGGVGDCYPSEAGARSFTPESPWQVANGGTGPQSTLFGTNGIDIVSYEVAPGVGVPANVGITTSATINPAGYSCVDTGLDPKEPSEPADTLTDCQDNLVVWGSNAIDPVDGIARSNASFDNLILKVSTDSDGSVVEVSGFYVLQFGIISPGYNSWLGGTLTLSGEVPEPPATPSVYAVTGASNSASTLYELDRDTAAVIRTVGPTGFSSITAMDFHPLTGELYAVAQDTSSCCPFQGDLLTLDLDTGTGTIVARTGAFTDMGFHPDGRLFGNGRPDLFDDRVFEIDIDTGAFTPVADFGHPTKHLCFRSGCPLHIIPSQYLG